MINFVKWISSCFSSPFRYYIPLALILNFVMPIVLACSLGESFVVAWNGNIFRYLCGLHIVSSELSCVKISHNIWNLRIRFGALIQWHIFGVIVLLISMLIFDLFWWQLFTINYSKRNITPTDSLFMGFVGFGEGWHNYHHCFPWVLEYSEDCINEDTAPLPQIQKWKVNNLI